MRAGTDAAGASICRVLHTAEFFGASDVAFAHALRLALAAHPEDIGVDEDVVEVPDDDREHGEGRLVEVDSADELERPRRDAVKDRDLEPQGQTGREHHDRAAGERPVFHLLPVGEAAVPRLLFGQPEVVRHRGDQLAPVRDAGRADPHARGGTEEGVGTAPEPGEDGPGDGAPWGEKVRWPRWYTPRAANTTPAARWVPASPPPGPVRRRGGGASRSGVRTPSRRG